MSEDMGIDLNWGTIEMSMESEVISDMRFDSTEPMNQYYPHLRIEVTGEKDKKEEEK